MAHKTRRFIGIPSLTNGRVAESTAKSYFIMDDHHHQTGDKYVKEVIICCFQVGYEPIRQICSNYPLNHTLRLGRRMRPQCLSEPAPWKHAH